MAAAAAADALVDLSDGRGVRPSRWWCITSFRPELTDRWLELPTAETDLVRYLVWQQERCPETDRVHLQGYIELRRPVRFSALKDLLGDTALHCELRHASRSAARDYCMKEESREEGPWHVGEWLPDAAGTRTDLRSFISRVREGATDSELLDEHPVETLRYECESPPFDGLEWNGSEEFWPEGLSEDMAHNLFFDSIIF